MKCRWTALALGIVFSVSLALIVGLRLSAEAMALVVGVLAGVVASVPASLIVVWFASRGRVTRTPMDIPARAPAEPRIVFLPPRQEPPAAAGLLAGLATYGPQSYAGYAPTQAPPGSYAIQPPLPARRFTVIGGAEVSDEFGMGEPGYSEEVVTWQR